MVREAVFNSLKFDMTVFNGALCNLMGLSDQALARSAVLLIPDMRKDQFEKVFAGFVKELYKSDDIATQRAAYSTMARFRALEAKSFLYQPEDLLVELMRDEHIYRFTNSFYWMLTVAIVTLPGRLRSCLCLPLTRGGSIMIYGGDAKLQRPA